MNTPKTEATTFDEKADSARTQEILAWAAEQERQRQEAGLPAPPLFPAEPPPPKLP